MCHKYTTADSLGLPDSGWKASEKNTDLRWSVYIFYTAGPVENYGAENQPANQAESTG